MGDALDLLGLDVGHKRTGIARASSAARIAEPLKTIETEKALDELKLLTENGGVEAIIVGLPRNLEGDDTEQTRWVRQWKAEAEKSVNVPFHFQDEALTTHLAMKRSPNTSHLIDAEAASIILQDFLDGKAG